MCGIAGYWKRDRDDKPFQKWLPEALTRLRHRGPDDRGVWHSSAGVGLGHMRLSILDLSPHGHQPMVSSDGNLVIVYNGEVYNYIQIKRELEALGHHFRGSGDTEVLLGAFCQWGVVEAVKRFIGMFAIGLWDERKRELSLIRDRLGVKPLYYGWDGKTLWFGSELKALRAFEHWVPCIDRTALREFFKFGYINSPRSIYTQISKLSPGHLLTLRADGEAKVSCYWSPLDSLGKPLVGNEEQLTAELEALMIDAFKLRMVADVPVGVFLSGGTDSSLVAAILQRHHGNIHTFTIGFNETSHDESASAKAVARHLGTVHDERILGMDEAKNILPKWIALCDEPFSDASGIPTFLVSKLASEKVKVVLSADGGDEVFLGYRAYANMLARDGLRRRLPAPLRSLLGCRALRGAFQKIAVAGTDWGLPRSLGAVLYDRIGRPGMKAVQYYSASTPGQVYEAGVSIWSDDELIWLLGENGSVREKADVYPGSFAEQMSLWDLHNYMPGDILAKVDLATMAASIEGREPLIDHRLVEFGIRLPMNLRSGSLGGKHILKRILHRYVPRELVERPKQGFGIPLGNWLGGSFQTLLNDHLSQSAVSAHAVLNPQAVETMLKRMALGSEHAAKQVWTLLLFQMWMEEWC